MSEKESVDTEQSVGKYLTFVLGDGEYAIDILRIQQVIQMQAMTRIPKAPKFVYGLINLRGKVIPVLNLHSKFNMESPEHTSKTCMLIVEIADKGKNMVVGIVFDEVKDVLEVTKEMLTATPAKSSQGGSVSANHIVGAVKVGNKVRFILALDEILDVSEMETLKRGCLIQ